MSNNAKVGGVLSIVAGGLGVIGAFFVLLFILALRYEFSVAPFYYYDYYYPDEIFAFITLIYTVMGVIGLLLGALAVVGGIYALRRKRWGLALAGSIASCFTFFPCGVPAIIFVAIGKPEFSAIPPPGPPR
jgi:hypothetical protein